MMKYLIIFLSIILFDPIDLNSQNTWIETNGPMTLTLSAFTVSSDGVWVVSATRRGVFFSTDQGKSWTKRSMGLYRNDSYATSLASGPNGIIYAMIDGEFYRKEKGIDVWDKSIYKFGNAKICANKNGTIFIYGGSFDLGLSFSNDKGETFKFILFSEFPQFEVLNLNGNNNNFFIAKDKRLDSYLVKFSDDGKVIEKFLQFDFTYPRLVWHPKGKLFLMDAIEGIIRIDSSGNVESKINTNNVKFDQLFVKPNGDLLGIAYEEDYISTDLGNSWKKQGTNIYKQISYSNLEFHDNNTYITYHTGCLDGSNSLQYSLDLGKNWENVTGSFDNPEYSSLIYSNGILYAQFCYSSDIHFTKDKGLTWLPLKKPNNYYNDFTTSSNGNIYMNFDDKVMKSDDIGENWKKLIVNNDTTIRSIVSDNKKSILAIGQLNFYISCDGGQIWKRVIKTPKAELSKLITFEDSTLLLINIYSFSDYSIFISKDLGLRWDVVPFDFLYIESITLLRDNTLVFSTTGQNDDGTFISKDKLSTYYKVSSKKFKTIIEDRNENLYAFENRVVCEISKDKGKSWKDLTTGLPVTILNESYALAKAMEIDEDGYLYLAYRNYPIFRTVNQVTNLSEQNSSSNNISLHSNIVDQLLILNFENSYDDLLDFSIFDQMGKIVLSEKRSIRDTKQLIVNVDQLNSGMYFINTQCKNRKNKLFKFIKT